MEHCNKVTYPQYQYQENQLEAVQHRATKLVPACKGMSYKDRLEHQNLPSLKYRRNRGDVIEVYKYVRGIIETDQLPFTRENMEQVTRGHIYKLLKPRCNTSFRQKFFLNRVINIWNNLPSAVAEATSLNSFKNRLDQHWKDYKCSVTIMPPAVHVKE